jgi:hypothetical protein
VANRHGKAAVGDPRVAHRVHRQRQPHSRRPQDLRRPGEGLARQGL